MNLGIYKWSNTNRMLTPDTIVPDPTNPQTFNRYSYVNNNPVNFTDPTGHYSCNISFNKAGVCVDAILSYEQQYHVEDMAGQLDAISPPDYPDNPLYGFGCTDTLVECFHQGFLKEFEDNEQINQQEFDDLLYAVAEDLYTHDIPTTITGQWIAGRGAYDTPFYNGGGRGGDERNAPYDSNQQICLEQGCFGRSEINYFAQGMWAAAGGYTLEEALAQTEAWNISSYPSMIITGVPEGKMYWTEYGYNWYIDWLEREGPPVLE